ncbi:MAG: hypothetical protein Rubg2KO_27010 [Rubricoccaceae bacterium]
MKALLPLLLVLVFAWGCDSDAPEIATFEGRYSGNASASFVTASGDVDILFDIDLDLDEPGQSGAFMGDATIARAAVGNASAQTGRGTVSGTRTGSTVSFSAIASQFSTRQATGRRAGDGLRLDAEGTFMSNGTLTLQATVLDFAFGRSESFSLVLEK